MPHKFTREEVAAKSNPRQVNVSGALPEAIEASEAQGQCELCLEAVLPIQRDAACEAALKSRGVVFSGAREDLFEKVTLPRGWSKQPTDHSMWSELVDDKGVVVAMMFYKAAFYDRDAFMRLAQTLGHR